MEIKSTSVPASPRSKRYPSGSTIIRGSGGGTTVVGGGGSSVDVLKTTSGMPLSDANVLSSLRTLIEIRKHFVAKDDAGRELADTNSFSSLRTVAEIDKAIEDLKTFLESNYLSKVKNDRAAGTIAFEKDITVGGQTTTLNLLVNALAYVYDLQVDHVATLFQTIIKDFVSSETFVPGMTGEGMKLYKALSGDWNLELDNVTVRKAITTFEMVIAKIRAVNGGLVVSAANGSVKSVSETTGDPAYYVLGIEGDMTFVADDLVRCQVFTAGRVKHYWLPIEQINGDSILLLKSGFPDGVIPAVGDELVQMGNRTDTSRQGVLYLTASEDGRPRFSVLDGVNSPSLDGKNNTVLGCLDGITDTDLPADFQPSGYGLYSMNVFLKGIFILRNGKSIDQALTELSTQIEAIPGQISMKVAEEVGKMQIGGRNYFKKSTPVIPLYGSPINIERLDSVNGLHLIGSSGGNSAIRMPNVIDSNGLWTVSFDTKGTQDTNGLAFIIDVCDNTKTTAGESAEVYLTSDNKYHHHEYTFNVQNYSSNVYNFVDFENLGWLYIYVRNLKIEKGSVATDWTPAPEDIETRMSQAEFSLKPENIWLGIKSDVQASTVPRQTINIDARGLDENMYYPVIIHIPNSPMTTITLHYTLEGIKPSWATHGSGFSVQIRWSNNGNGWGTIEDQRIIHEATQRFNIGNVAGNIGQITQYNKEYIYVRGGGYYHLSVEGTELSPHTRLYPNGYQEGGAPYVMRIDPISSVTFPVASIPAIIETGIDITNRKMILSADKTVFRNNSGGQIAVFENDRIKADLIDARQIVVNGLNAGRISTGNLDVSSGAKIGSFLINGSEILSKEDVIFGIQTSKGTTAMDAQGINIFNKNGQVALNVQGGNAQIGGNAFYANYSTYSFSGGTININNAMTLRGAVCVNVRKVYASSPVWDSDYFIACYNTSSITLTLPNSPQMGRVIVAKRMNNAHIEVQGGVNRIYASSALTSVGIVRTGQTQRFTFDGQYWLREFIENG